MIKKVFAILFPLLSFQISFSQSVKTLWVDSVFNTLNVSEKVGQLFMVPIDANSDAATIDEITELIQSHEIGGIILTDKSLLPPATLLTSFQQMSDVPLFFSYQGLPDALLDSALGFPKPEILGAVNNDTLIYRYGTLLANQLKRNGLNLAFTPIHIPPTLLPSPELEENTLNVQNKERLTSKSLALMRGLQDHGITTCAKYFQVSGVTVRTLKDDMPVVNITVDSIQSFPYVSLIANGLKGVMPAATELPVFYDDIDLAKKNYTATALTSAFAGDWLKKKLNYQGLTFIETENIRKASYKDKEGEAEAFAFLAGNEVLITKDFEIAIRKIKRLVRKDDAYAQHLDNLVKSILAAKFDAGLWQQPEQITQLAATRATDIETRLLNQKLHEAAITVIRNDKQTVPVQFLENKRFAYVSTFASEENHTFYQYLKRYTHIDFYTLEDRTDQLELNKTLRDHDVIVVGVFPQSADRSLKRLNNVLEKLQHNPEVIICDFGHKSFLKTAYRFPSVITAYTDTREMHKAVPQVLFGALPASGTLPYTVSSIFKEGTGIPTPSLQRLAYSLPEDAGMDSRMLQRIDSIAKEAIDIQATPGCQVFVARNGKVIYEKSFGYLTYDKKDPVTSETIYDIASITKVSATLQTAMFMQERGLIDLHKKVSYYLPELKETNKKDITLIDMLTHQSGLAPFIPMYPLTLKDTTFLPLYYSHAQSEQYPLQVASNLYASPVIRDSVWVWIKESEMNQKPPRTPYSYRYSDLGFLILQRIAEKILNQPLDDFVYQNFYEPLGAYTTGFNPLSRFNKQIIAPTEDDKIYRRTSVSGTVHDERAAMLGGVAGHAGVFSSANDLGKLGQMLLQEGTYGGYQYYKPETIRLFTAKKFRTSRRGIGWDKPIQSEWNSPTSLYASPATFGHTGFTGTCMWIDPEFDLVYIFLSNRVYPDRSGKLINANIRSRIQDVVYKAIFTYQEQEKAPYKVEVAIKPSENRPLE